MRKLEKSREREKGRGGYIIPFKNSVKKMRKLEERGGCIIPFGAMYACIESKYIYIYIRKGCGGIRFRERGIDDKEKLSRFPRFIS